MLALAVARGRLSAEEAWRIAHVDEDFQNERWGVDAEAAARRAARWREMEAAAATLAGDRRLVKRERQTASRYDALTGAGATRGFVSGSKAASMPISGRNAQTL